MSASEWRPFAIDDRAFDDAGGGPGPRILNVTFRRPKSAPKDGASGPPGRHSYQRQRCSSACWP